MHKFSTLIFVGVFVAGCAIGPDFVQPGAPASDAFEGAQTSGYLTAEPDLDFWESFNDQVLSELIETALTENTDLRVAMARLDRARAISRNTGLDLLPEITASGSYISEGVTAERAGNGPRGRYDETYTGSIDAFWELDLFGRVRRAYEAQSAQTAAAASDFKALQVSVAAEVAQTYMQLRGAQEQLRIAQENAANQQRTLELTEARLEAGRGTELDTSRARFQLETTRSTLPVLETEIAVAANRLAVLGGREPSALLLDLRDAAALPTLPERVAVGTPADLIRRRPDVHAAEQRLRSATAQVGVAMGDLFPRLVINGSIATTAPTFGDLFTGASENYTLGPRITWAFLGLERVRMRINMADADAEGALATYEGTVLRALEESENALVTYDRARRESEHLKESADAATLAMDLARQRFENGVSNFLEVLDAERSLLSAQSGLAQSRSRTAIALVAVYKAVAGGWPEHAEQLAGH